MRCCRISVFPTRPALGLLSLLGALSPLAWAHADDSSTAPAIAPATELTCETSAVVLDANPFEASQGQIALKILEKTEGDAAGTWSVANVAADHGSSFAVAAKTNCTEGCPVTRGKDGAWQLWSPEPMGLTQIPEGTTLVIVSLDPQSLELKASSFRGKELAALERGPCTKDGEAAKPPPQAADDKAATDTEPAATPNAAKPAPAAEPEKEK